MFSGSIAAISKNLNEWPRLVHKPSPRAFVRRIRTATAFRDRELAETVCLATVKGLAKAVKLKYGPVKGDPFGDVQRGDILYDQRCRGVFDRIPAAKEVGT